MNTRGWWSGPLLIALLCARSALAQSPVGVGADLEAPASAWAGEKVVGEALAGGLLAVIASWGFAWMGAEILGPHGGEDPGVTGAITGFMVGTAIGASAGVHFAAREFGLPASYWEALGGAVVGSLVLFAVPLDADEVRFWAAVYGLPILGAVAASSIGSQSRMRPTARATTHGIGVGLAVSF